MRYNGVGRVQVKLKFSSVGLRNIALFPKRRGLFEACLFRVEGNVR